MLFRSLRCDDPTAELGLIVQPALRNEHRKEPEHDRNANHHDGIFTQRTPRKFCLLVVRGKVRVETYSFLKFGVRMLLC